MNRYIGKISDKNHIEIKKYTHSTKLGLWLISLSQVLIDTCMRIHTWMCT